MPVNWTAAGEMIEDEVVEFLQEIEVDATPYYIGWLSNRTNRELGDEGQSNSVCYTGAGGSGDRIVVRVAPVDLSGDNPSLPADSSEVVLEIETGKIIATTDAALYFTYRGFGEFVRPVKYAVIIDEVMQDAEDRDWFVGGVFQNMEIVAFSWLAKIAPSEVANATPVLELRTDVDGGGAGESLDLGEVGIDTGGAMHGKITYLDAPLKFSTADKFVVTGDGKNVGGLTIFFF